MMEYLLVDAWADNHAADVLTTRFNILARDGWQFVAFRPGFQVSYLSGKPLALFEREVK